MTCPSCKSRMKCIDSHNLRRRYRCGCGHRITTREAIETGAVQVTISAERYRVLVNAALKLDRIREAACQ